MVIKLFESKLPTTDELTPNLKKIEIERRYSNFGPMVEDLENRLSKYFGVQIDELVTTSNATLALEAAVQTSGNDLRWLTPSWTFTATNLALARAGVEYTFGDVDDNWRLQIVAGYDAIMDVCAFGDSISLNRFSEFKSTLLIDAAGSFAALENLGTLLKTRKSPTGVVVSFHPTKMLPGIEGGVFISNNKDWVAKVRYWTNFGMDTKSVERNSHQIGTNAKMNEFQAAVIICSLEKYFTELKDEWKNLHDIARQISRQVGIQTHPAMKRGLLSTYWVVQADSITIQNIEKTFSRRGIETRRWWGFGTHRMDFFKEKKSAPLPNTNRIAMNSLGIPFHLFLSPSNFSIILDSLSEGIRLESPLNPISK